LDYGRTFKTHRKLKTKTELQEHFICSVWCKRALILGGSVEFGHGEDMKDK
jgi:hypothetical protein